MKWTFDRECASLLLFMAFSETVITLTFQTIKTGSWKSTIRFKKQLEHTHMKANQTAPHWAVKMLPSPSNTWGLKSVQR